MVSDRTKTSNCGLPASRGLQRYWRASSIDVKRLQLASSLTISDLGISSDVALLGLG